MWVLAFVLSQLCAPNCFASHTGGIATPLEQHSCCNQALSYETLIGAAVTDYLCNGDLSQTICIRLAPDARRRMQSIHWNLEAGVSLNLFDG